MSEPTSGYSFKYFWTNLLQSGFNSSQTFISTKQRFSFFYNKLKVLTQAHNPGRTGNFDQHVSKTMAVLIRVSNKYHIPIVFVRKKSTRYCDNRAVKN